MKSTRRTKSLLAFALALAALAAASASAQEPYTSETDDYAVELPSQTWKSIARPDGHQHTEFVYGERSSGHLRVRKEVLEGSVKNLSDLARSEQDTKFRFLSGFVGGKEERFAGRLPGLVSTYEYTSGGRTMAGRVYYLQADNRTVYALHFTGVRDRLQLIQNQTDAIARSFRLKQ